MHMHDVTDTEIVPEANVLIELCPNDPMSLEVLDANSDDVLEAVHEHASDVALGATVSLRQRDNAILLRFDVLASNEAEAYRAIATVLERIEQHTDVKIVRSRSEVEVIERPDRQPALA